MKTQNGFTLLEKISEISTYLAKQKVTRKITTGRNLNSTPIGIRGWNTNAICIEIYGDFDKGKDVMTKAQKEAVIALYGELCKRFNIPVNTTHIRPHCWFTAGGTYLGKYDPNRSAKTCPGTNFMGYGCSPSGFAKFINEVKAYVDDKEAPKEEAEARIAELQAAVDAKDAVIAGLVDAAAAHAAKDDEEKAKLEAAVVALEDAVARAKGEPEEAPVDPEPENPIEPAEPKPAE